MTENSALMVTTLDDTLKLGAKLAASGYFKDVAEEGQALAKILAGREMGFGPIASLTGIHIIKGKVSLSAGLMANALKRSPKYDYRVTTLTDEKVEIAFYEQGAELGRSEFTKADATRAGTQNMAKYPRNMLYARAMSNGVKWFCPDVFVTLVYTPEEMGAQVDGEGEIIDVTPTRIERPGAPTTATQQATTTLPQTTNGGNGHGRSWPAHIIQAVLEHQYAANAPNAVRMLNLSEAITEADELDIVLEWCQHYRGARGGGDEPVPAAKYADGKVKLPEPEEPADGAVEDTQQEAVDMGQAEMAR